MFRATKDIILPTTITGSLPRPSWYTENLGTRHFLDLIGAAEPAALGHEALRSGRHERDHLVPGLDEEARQLRGLVGGDSAGDPEQNALPGNIGHRDSA